MPEEVEKKNRIGLITMILMPMFAIFFDLLSCFIPVVGSLAWVVIAIWLFILGISPFTLRRILMMGGSFLVELIPIISIIPSITLGVIAIIIMIKSEDKLGLKPSAIK